MKPKINLKTCSVLHLLHVQILWKLVQKERFLKAGYVLFQPVCVELERERGKTDKRRPHDSDGVLI